MPILAFHKIENNFNIGLNNYSPGRFNKLLRYLKNAEFKFVSLQEYLSLSGDDKIISLTFDDGYESFYDNALPILNELELPSTVFIPAGFIDKTDNWDYSGSLTPSRHLSKKQIAELPRLNVEVGSHGLSHRSLSGLSERLLKLEVGKSKEILENITDGKVRYISYPFGRFDRAVEETALASGYDRGFSLSSYKESGLAFTHSRFAVYAFDTPYSVNQKCGGAIKNRLEKLKGAIMNRYAGGTILLNKIRRQ